MMMISFEGRNKSIDEFPDASSIRDVNDKTRFAQCP